VGIDREPALCSFELGHWYLYKNGGMKKYVELCQGNCVIGFGNCNDNHGSRCSTSYFEVGAEYF
jgi:hypothetical protein